MLANGVLHHFDPTCQAVAMARLAGLLEPGGVLIASLRDGAGPSGSPPGRRCGAAGSRWRRRVGLDLCGGWRGLRFPAETGALGVTWHLGAARRPSEVADL